MRQTALAISAAGDIASATNIGGAASTDGGLSFHRTNFGDTYSVAWWQGASGSWLMFGQSPYGTYPGAVSGFENWSPNTPPVDGGNVAHSSLRDDLGIQPVPFAVPYVDSIAGVPGADTAFIDADSSVECPGSNCVEGDVNRVEIDQGPSFSHITRIGGGVITKPGPLAYCSASGSSLSLADILLVVAEDSSGGALYRVTGATEPISDQGGGFTRHRWRARATFASGRLRDGDRHRGIWRRRGRAAAVLRRRADIQPGCGPVGGWR